MCKRIQNTDSITLRYRRFASIIDPCHMHELNRFADNLLCAYRRNDDFSQHVCMQQVFVFYARNDLFVLKCYIKP